MPGGRRTRAPRNCGANRTARRRQNGRGRPPANAGTRTGCRPRTGTEGSGPPPPRVGGPPCRLGSRSPWR
eukprot:11220495-Lingulodinium_polyedra.AAC.1